MKKITISLPVIALALGIATSAFTTVRVNNARPSADQWYRFNGDPTNQSDLNDPAKYSPIEAPTCVTGVLRCEILATPSSNPDQPDLDQIHNETKKS